MIRMKCLTGPYAGKVRELGPEINPVDLLEAFLQHGWEWEIDYSQATGNEAVRWVRADLAMRAIRAMKKSLPVSFMGKVYTDPAQLEDAIAYSGKGVSLGQDDETGMEIVAYDLPEPEPEPWAVLRRAQEWIEVHSQEFLEAGKQVPSWRKKYAFARAVAWLVVRFPPGVVGGPTSREYAVIEFFGDSVYTFEEAVEILSQEDGLMFGPITDLHRKSWKNESCVDDDPEDIRELSKQG